MLEVRDLVGGYGDSDVLHQLSIGVEQDQIVSIVGPNGAGKTTLARMIFGLLTPRQGDVFFKGKKIR